MGGCITPPQAKKSKLPKKQPQPKSKQTLNSRQQIVNLSLDNSRAPLIQNNKRAEPLVPQKPKYEIITGQQFCRAYRLQDMIGTTTRAEGPIYISNYTDGIGKVLRVIPFGIQSSLAASSKQVDLESRVKAYVEILNLQILSDDQSNLLILQEYYCGPYLHQVAAKDLGSQTNREEIRRFLSQIHQIICSFHQRGVILGNLSIFSFRQASQFDSSVKMVQLNLVSNYEEAMGHAFKAEKSMDWQSFAFIVQSVLAPQPPVFIPHKIQYIQNSNNTVNALLRGKKIKREQIDNLKYCMPNKDLITGYRFRADINRLLKLRKRRLHHRGIYYSEDVVQNGEKLSDEAMQRFQTSRIFDRIETYIGDLNPQCQQAFLMYSSSNQTLKKLKATFITKQSNKKMEQLKQTLPLIK